MNNRINKHNNGAVLLFITAFIWGIAFVFQAKSMDYMKPLTFMASRNFLASVFLSPIVIYKARHSRINRLITIKGGILCGLVLISADFCQQYGITMTSVGKTGFITTLYIIFTPILGVFLHKKVAFKVWIAAVIAMLGMYMICMTDSISLSRGDTFVLACAVLFAVHILVIDNYAPYTDGVVISFVQFTTCFICCTLLSLIFEKPQLSQIENGITSVLYAGVISSGIGYTLQTVGQKGVNPTISALILSLESVFSAIAGYVAWRLGVLNTDQSLTARQIIGCILVFTAVIFIQLPNTVTFVNIFKMKLERDD